MILAVALKIASVANLVVSFEICGMAVWRGVKVGRFSGEYNLLRGMCKTVVSNNS